MTLKAEIPDVDLLKSLDCAGFARIVCSSLARHGIQKPGFNLAAGTMTGADDHVLLLYPAEAEGVVGAGLKALREYDAEKRITAASREEFIIADVKDVLGSMDADKTSPQYRALCDNVMGYVASRMTGIGSLALSPASPDYSKKNRGPGVI
jgi:hypothetical protein